MRVRGVLSTEALAAATELDPLAVRDVLVDVSGSAHVRQHATTPAGWALTAQGRRHAEDLMMREIDRMGALREVLAAYRDFLGLNPALLKVCSNWQVRIDSTGTEVVNDHDDAQYDASVLVRLGDLHAQALPVLDDLGATLGRFGGYRERLTYAWDRVQSGDVEWFTKPTIDSYHTVWFQLHEDLLASLGRQRNDEAR